MIGLLIILAKRPFSHLYMKNWELSSFWSIKLPSVVYLLHHLCDIISVQIAIYVLQGAQLRQHIDATLGSGNLREAVRLPPGEDFNEWLAVNSKFSSSIRPSLTLAVPLSLSVVYFWVRLFLCSDLCSIYMYIKGISLGCCGCGCISMYMCHCVWEIWVYLQMCFRHMAACWFNAFPFPFRLF